MVETIWLCVTGGDGEKDLDEEEEYQNKKQDKDHDLTRLNKFLEKAGQVYHYLSTCTLQFFCDWRKVPVHVSILSMSFYAPQRGKHIVATLSVRPVPCPANNFKTTVAIQIKLGI